MWGCKGDTEGVYFLSTSLSLTVALLCAAWLSCLGLLASGSTIKISACVLVMDHPKQHDALTSCMSLRQVWHAL